MIDARRLAGYLLAGVIAATSASAAIFQVSTTSDLPDATVGDGICATTELLPSGAPACSLRAAIEESNALATANVVQLPAGLFELTNGSLVVTNSVELKGAGIDVTVIDGLGLSSVISIPGIPTGQADFQASDLTMRRGALNESTIRCVSVPYGDPGSSSITLDRVRVTAGLGFGVDVFAEYGACSLIFEDSIFDFNDRGGVNMYGFVSDFVLGVTRSRFESNGGNGLSLSIVEGGGDPGGLIFDSVFADNAGFGVFRGEFGPLVIERAIVARNQGGGIRTGGEDGITILKTRIVDNHGSGLVFSDAEGVHPNEIRETEFSGNSTTGNGGGIHMISDRPLRLVNVTVSGNSAEKGGGIYIGDGIAASRIEIISSTITDNTAAEGGGVFIKFQYLSTIKHSILAGNSAALGPDCLVDAASLPFDLIGENAIGVADGCSFTGDTSLLQQGTLASPLLPGLGPLAFNGGTTRTHLLVPSSPGIDAVAESAGCELRDQRGASRPADGDGDASARCDLGAAEATDFDRDSIADNLDLCPGESDPGQPDGDGDGIGDLCDAYPADPLNQKSACELGLDTCSVDLAICGSDVTTCGDDLALCQTDEVALQQSLAACQTGPPFVGDINRDGAVDLLDTVLSRRLLAKLPIEPPEPAVTSLLLRDGSTDELLETVDDGDVYSLATLGSCLAIQVTVNQSTENIRYDYTPPSGIPMATALAENFPPYCWSVEEGWAFGSEVADCGCSPEMADIGSHQLVITPCSVDVNYGAGESCVGNGGVEGVPTIVDFAVTP